MSNMGDWLAKLTPPRQIRPQTRLPGDTPAIIDALHALSRAGLLPANTVSYYSMPCPRCGRLTSVSRSQYLDCWPPPSVCNRCRAEWIRDHPDWIARWHGMTEPEPVSGGEAESTAAVKNDPPATLNKDLW